MFELRTSCPHPIPSSHHPIIPSHSIPSCHVMSCLSGPIFPSSLHPIPSHPIIPFSHHPIPSHPIPSHHPIPSSHPIPSHPRLLWDLQGCRRALGSAPPLALSVPLAPVLTFIYLLAWDIPSSAPLAWTGPVFGWFWEIKILMLNGECLQNQLVMHAQQLLPEQIFRDEHPWQSKDLNCQ